MQDYSIDLASERITHPKTKEYFREVMSSYAIGNYRSAVASLYTIVISDLVFKLKDQVERENDQGADQILREVEAEKTKNDDRFSSKWESDLVDKVLKRTKLLELGDKAAIDHLKNQRNLSSHPNILDTEENTLFTPTKEDVRAHIRSMLEGVLTKSSVHTVKLVDQIIEHRMPDLYGRAEDETSYDHMFTNRYLRNLNEEAIKSLFKKVWKFTFRLDDQKCDEHRDVNARTLLLITKVYPELVFHCISKDQAYYSIVTLERDHLNKMIDYFVSTPRLFKLLDKDLQKEFERKTLQDPTFYVRSIFLSASMEDHFHKAKKYLEPRDFPTSTLTAYQKITAELNKKEEYFKLLINYYSKSKSPINAMQRFAVIERRINLESLDETQLHDLLKAMNSKIPLSKERNIWTDFVLKIQETAELKLGKQLDLSTYFKL